uniref:Uncharacterized protein n=1 Tax=Arundo donax TaxID=35708 RepID=A0A0A9HCI7_ARUDO
MLLVDPTACFFICLPNQYASHKVYLQLLLPCLPYPPFWISSLIACLIRGKVLAGVKLHCAGNDANLSFKLPLLGE